VGVLFISHSSQDNDHAVRVRDWLKSQGWGEVFLDLDPAQGLAPGQRWQEELKRAGENCAAVVVLVSPNWVASVWCRTEFLVADQLGKRIFPVFVAPTSFDELPLELRAKFQLADISTPEKEAEGFQRLAIGLKRAGLDPKSFDWPPPSDPNRSVYRGLQALDVQDAAIFFGRDAAVTRGLDELRRLRDGAPQRILVILGASGAGKSSFLRAGLIARLRRDDENFLVLPIVRPERAAIGGAQGLAASVSKALGRPVSLSGGAADLAQAFADLRKPVVERLTRNAEAARETYTAKPPTIILPLDQAEELFGAQNTERAAFCDIAAKAIAQDGNALIVATIRSDSYEPLQTEPLLAGAPQLLFNLPPLAAGSFQSVIEGPARLAKPPLTVEPALTQQLLADLDAADALPLLAFTLERLQTQFGADGNLTLADYRDKLGGLAGAIQSAVDAVLGAQPSKEKLALARRLFVPALVQVDQDGVKRRVARRQDIPSEAQALANSFIEQRLLVTDDGTVEVAHEAILRQWPALVAWITEERGALVVLDSVRAAAREWQAHAERRVGKRGESWLAHRGDRLKEAEKIAARADFASAVDQPIRDYLAACRKEERRAAGTRRRLQALAAVSALAVIGVGAAWMNWDRIQPELVRLTRYAPHANRAEALADLSPGDTFQDCAAASKHCPVMVVLPAGEFMMGDPPQSPEDTQQRRINVARFAVSQFEVAFDDWAGCVAGGGCAALPSPGDAGWGRDNRPVINVSWDDAKEYVDWLSRMTGEDYRLLTEAEWEYAARAVTSIDRPSTLWGFGDDETQLGEYAWFSENSEQQAHPVGEKRPNAFGLYDMHGNVWEWVEDCYAPYDPEQRDSSAVEGDGQEQDGGATASRSENATTCSLRVLRGGSWGGSPQDLRSAIRFWNVPSSRHGNVGFRVARTVSPPNP